MSEYKLLDRINSPSDVKKLNTEELPVLASEIREFLIENVTRNGGHLASNLGVVELSIALHRVFSTPHDRIIFDVGHQSYVHKMLTGRKDFSTLRRGGGISGFQRRAESEHDCFGGGHSSTSVSAAMGFANADRLDGLDAYTVAVVGDGAFTGGMIHEALNNCDGNSRLIIILNENEMSISKNIGRFADGLSKIRSSEGYFLTKRATVKFLSVIPLVGKPLLSVLKKVKRSIKNILYGSNYFENMGLYYLGPIDGNDVFAVEDILKLAKEQKDSVVIHLKTKKGKGYRPAEENADRYHSLSPADSKTRCEFSRKFGEDLVGLGREDDRVCAITAAMCSGTGLDGFKKEFPTRFFDVGIAEQHAVTYAAGLAAAGKRPFVAIYSTFLQRAYDSIIHDVALQNLPVCFCIDRAGLNPSDGATHHGIFDVSFLSSIPNIKIYTPATYDALSVALRYALASDTPSAIRYPKGQQDGRVVERFYGREKLWEAGARCDFDGDVDAVIVTHGEMASIAIDAEDRLSEKGVRVGTILLEFIKPYKKSAELVADLLPDKKVPVVTLEEEIKCGGMGMMLLDSLSGFDKMQGRKSAVMALDDSFAIQDADESIYKTVHISPEDVERTVISLLN